jgi:hypothetical protein
MSYIGRQNLGGAYRQLDDISSGFDGSDTTHTMQVNSQNVTVGDVNQIILSLGGVIQKPGTDFTVSGSVLTFTTAPASSTSFFAILLGSDNGGTVTPTDVSVTKAKLADEVDIFAGTSLTAADLGSGVHIRVADSSASVDAAADELVLENSGNAGLSILSGTTSTGQVAFGDSGDNNRALISYSHNTDHMTITHEGDESIVMGGGRFQTGGETSGGVDAGGLCLNHGANDGFIMTFKSSDIAHGMTDLGDTDTYAFFKKANANYGGLEINCMTEEFDSLQLQGFATSEDNSKSTSAEANIVIRARKKSGTAWGVHGSNANLLSVANHNTVRFFFDSEGDFHADSSSTTFDAYEDAHLVRAYDLSHGKGVIDSKFDKFVSYNHEKLADLQLVGREKDGAPNHFVNVTGMQRLHNGAIWQQYEKHQKLAEAVYEMAKEALGEEKADAILEKHDIKLLN